MSVRLSCPLGHEWEIAEHVSKSETCPTCGAVAETIIAADSEPVTEAGMDELPPPPRSSAAAIPEAAKVAAGSTERKLPEQFGRYRIVEPLGRGGMGSVFLAHDSQLDRNVALKVPRFQGSDETQRERFCREARAAATLDHPNICSVYDVGEFEGVQFLSMAYIEGWPLSKLIKEQHGLPQHAVADLVRKLALAMAEAHAKGVVHRDLKPPNIMINDRHEPVITDFGLARRESSDDARLTSEGAILGTPAYMAPEQVAGDTVRIGGATDIYALGVILYELLTGRLPFEGSIGQLLSRIATEPPQPPSEHRPEVDPVLESICLKALSKNLEDRFGSMTEFAAALQDFLADQRTPTERGGGIEASERAEQSPAAELSTSEPAFTSDDRATDLLAKLAAQIDSVQKLQQSHAESLLPRGTPWTAIAAVVAIALLLGFLVNPFRPSSPTPQVSVRFTQIEIWIDQPDVTFLLDGEPVSAKQVVAGLEVQPEREHTFTVKQAGKVVAERTFIAGSGQTPVLALNHRLPYAAPMNDGSPDSKLDPGPEAVVSGNPQQGIKVDESLSLWTRRYYTANNPLASKLTINGQHVGVFDGDTKQNIARHIKPGLNTFVFETTPDQSAEKWNSLRFTFGPVRKNADGEDALSPVWSFYSGENWEREGGRFKHRLDPDLKTVRVTVYWNYAGFEGEREVREGDYVLQSSPYYDGVTTSVTATVFVNGVPLTSLGGPKRQVVITDLLKKGHNVIKLVSRPVDNILKDNDVRIAILGPAERNVRRDGFEFRPVSWFSASTGWKRHRKTAKLVNTVSKEAEAIERIFPLYLRDDPHAGRETAGTPELTVWTEQHYDNTGIPLHSQVRVNGELAGVFTAKSRESLSHLREGAFHEVSVQTKAQYPVAQWNELRFHIGWAGRAEDGSLQKSPLWRFSNGDGWSLKDGRLRHASDSAKTEPQLTFSLFYAGEKHENRKLSKGDYVVSGRTASLVGAPSVTATLYVNGEPLNTFAGQARSVVITPLLKAGGNEIKIVTVPVAGQMKDNDILFTIGGPAEYDRSAGEYKYPVIKEFQSLTGWIRNQQTGRLESVAPVGAARIERAIQFDLKNLP